ncbi:HEAT repeat domain-containing protein [Clostridium algidicarnis]|uniref:HEAT repeat domain-containing protein n=1 Tax=Clostridium algidicarnis TaxID=37659 RepID=UPI001C0CDC01|nr:hypothetical protein [Clostridium algidicarnis]MBU3227694.1 hypothetical protein [Clostridium algidicarnis]MBU3250899.1 hypothetical protein [Clostridium algidicarnis]
MINDLNMTPYELGESGNVENIVHIIEYIKDGNINEKRLAASALRKMSVYYKEDCNKAIDYLMQNLNTTAPQLRQYSLKALKELDLSKEHLLILKKYIQKEDKQYNIIIYDEIFGKYQYAKNDVIKETTCANDLSNLSIMEYFNGTKEITLNLKEDYKNKSQVFINNLYESAQLIINDKILLEIFKKRYCVNKYYTLQSLSKEYNLSRNYIEDSMENCINKIAESISEELQMKDHGNKFINLYNNITHILKMEEKRTFIERLVLFLYWGFPKSHLKLMVKVIMMIIYNNPKEWKQESVISSYEKFLDNLYKSKVKDNFRKILYKNIFWPENIKILGIEQFKMINTIEYLKKDLEKKGKFVKSEKLNINIYYKSLYQKDLLKNLELLEEVIFYSTFNFRLKGDSYGEYYINDIFFVLKDGRSVVVLTPINEKDLTKANKNRDLAFKNLCKEKGLGICIFES